MTEERARRRRNTSRIGIALVFLFSLFPINSRAAGWTNHSGHEISGDPIAFDFTKKAFTFRDPVTKQERTVPTAELSLQSRQRLLFSPAYLTAKSGEELWPAEKRHLILLTAGAFAAAFFVALWITALVLLRKWNPVLAVTGFLGTWIVIAILAACYAFLHQRFGGDSRILYLGGAVTVTITPLFLSSVYNCSYGKAHLLLYLHLIVGACVLGLTLFATELIAGTERTEAWWNRHVFEPVGLIESIADPRTGP